MEWVRRPVSVSATATVDSAGSTNTSPTTSDLPLFQSPSGRGMGCPYTIERQSCNNDVHRTIGVLVREPVRNIIADHSRNRYQQHRTQNYTKPKYYSTTSVTSGRWKLDELRRNDLDAV